MPASQQILSGLAEIANSWRALAIVWHVYFAVLALGLILGARPSKCMAGILLGLPLFSVSALAWAAANPFNGTFFGISGSALIAASVRLPRDPVQTASAWVVIMGAFMFIFGWMYPHFFDTSSWVSYLYAAPVGLVPCPTLSVVVGLSLALGGLGSRAWSLVLSVTGMFYGVFGALHLGVTIDWVLFLGGLLIALLVLVPRIGAQSDVVSATGASTSGAK